MGKRKVALFMAAILTVTSVYPGGAVFAEEAVATEPAIEAAADEALETQDAFAEEISSADMLADVAESVDAQVDTAAEQASTPEGVSGTMEAKSEESAEAADEDMADEWDEPIDIENLPGDVTAAELVDGDNGFIADISVVNEIEPILEGVEPENKIVSASIELPKTEFNAYSVANDLIVPITVTYEDGTTEEDINYTSVSSYSYASSTDKETIFAVYYDTSRGNRLNLTMWSGDQLVSIPTYDSPVLTGEFTLQLIEDEVKLGEAKPITIMAPENEVSLTEGEENARMFNLPPDGSAWYSFTSTEEIDCTMRWSPTEGWTNYRIYTYDNSILTPVTYMPNPNGTVWFTAEKGTTYHIIVHEESKENSSSGKIGLTKRTVKAVKLIDFALQDEYGLCPLREVLMGKQAVVTYEDGSSETVTAWGGGFTDPESGQSADVICFDLSGDNRIFLTMWSGGKLLDMPSAGDSICTGTFTLQFFVGNQKYGEPKEITIQGPEIAEKLTVGETKSYSFNVGERMWYSFTAEEADDYMIETKWTGGMTSLALLYTYGDGSLQPISNYGSRTISFTAKPGVSYAIEVFEDELNEDYDEDPGDTIEGTICIRKKMTISSARIMGENSYDVLTFNNELRRLPVEISYTDNEEDADPETVSSWSEAWYQNEEAENGYNAYGCITDNGDKALLVVSEDDILFDIPFDKSFSHIGTITVTLYINGKEYDHKDIEVSFPETTGTLTEGTSVDYNLQPGESALYSFTAAENAGYIPNLTQETGTVRLEVYEKTDNKLNEIYILPNGSAAGTEYLLRVWDYADGTATGTLSIKKKLEVASVTGFELETEYSRLNAVDALYAAAKKLTVEYTNGDSETISSWEGRWYEGESEDIRGIVGETLNCNSVELRMKKDGADYSIPGEGRFLETGSYSVLIFVDGAEQEESAQTFEVTTEAMETIGLDEPKEVALTDGESKWFLFSAQEDGRYVIFSSPAAVDSEVYLYNADLEEVDYNDDSAGDSNFSLTSRLTAGEDYYYQVSGLGKKAATFTVTLRKLKEVESAELEAGTEKSYSWLTLADELKRVSAVIHYAGETQTETETVSSWVESWIYDPETEEEYDVLRSSTSSGETVYLALYADDLITDMLGSGGNHEIRTDAKYTLRLMAADKVCQNLDLNIDFDIQGATELEPDGDPGQYALSAGECRQYAFTTGSADTGEFVVSHEDTEDGVTLYVYKYRDNALQRINYSDGTVLFQAEPDTTYIAVLRARDWVYTTEGSVKVFRKKTIASVKLNVKGDYEIASSGYPGLQAEISYTNEDAPELVDYQGEWVDSNGVQCWSGTSMNGDEVKFAVLSGGQIVSAPVYYYYDEEEERSCRYCRPGTYTVRLVVNDVEYTETDTEFTIIDPDNEPNSELTTGADSVSYTLDPAGHAWYVFTPGEKDAGEDFAILNDSDGSVRTELFMDMGDYLLSVNDTDYSRLAFRAKQGARYLLAVYRPYQGNGVINGSIRIEKKKGISSVVLELADEGDYDVYEVAERLLSVRASVTYEGEELPVLYDEWTDTWYDGENGSFDVLSPTAASTSEIYLTLWSGNQMIDMPQPNNYYDGAQIPTGEFTLKLIADGKLYDVEGATQQLTISMPQEGAAGLKTGVPQEFSLGAEEHIWYTFTAEEAAEYNAQLKLSSGSAYMFLYEEENGRWCKKNRIYTTNAPFSAKKGQEYKIAVYWDYGSPKGKVSVNLRRTVESAKFTTLEKSYDLLTLMESLKNVQAEISYTTGEPETVSYWSDDRYTMSSDGALHCITDNGTEAYLLIYDMNGKRLSLPVYSEENTLTAGSYVLKLFIDGKEKDSREITLTETEGETLPESWTAAVGDTKLFAIPAQDKDMILRAEVTADKTVSFSTALYRKTKDEGVTSTTKWISLGESRFYLDAGCEYLLSFTNESNYTGTVAFSMIERPAFESVTDFTLGGKIYTKLEALSAVRAAAAGLKVNYTDESSETVPAGSWYTSNFYQGSSYVTYLTCITKNGNELQIRLRKDGQYYSVPDDEILDAGSYSAELYVDGKLMTDCKADFTVTEEDMGSIRKLEIDKSYPVVVEEGGSEWFSYTPTEEGEYTLYSSSEDVDSNAKLYNSNLELLAQKQFFVDGSFSVSHFMKAGETYYYKVSGYYSQAASFDVTLTKKTELTGVKLEQEQSKLAFTEDEDITVDAKMTFLYANGSSEEHINVSDYVKDKFDNRIFIWMYPYNEETGEADRTQTVYMAGGYHKAGKYLIEAKACHYDLDEGFYIPYEGADYKTMSVVITVTESQHEHSYEWVVVQNATCTKQGTRELRCKCGEVQKTEVIPPKGHTKVVDEETSQDATCTEDGVTNYKCSVCGESLPEEKETQPAAGHKKMVDEETSQDATCTEDGVTNYKCSVCGEPLPEEKVTTQATGHEKIVDEENSKAATCTEDGVTNYKCSVCGVALPEEKVTTQATGHEKIVDEENSKAATCTEDGVTNYKCSVCGELLPEEKVTTQATGHEKVVDEENSKAATCTEPGETVYKCGKCGVPLGGPEETGPLGHNWVAGQIVAAATVTTAAQRQYECSICHKTETRPEGSPLPATLTVPATKANMKTGQSTSVFTVGMTAGDSIVSVTSSNTKLMKVSSINKTKGTFKLKAGKKTGKVKITIKLASGQSKVITLTVQKKKVTTKKVKVTKKLTLKKGAKYTLKPVVTPITTQDKVKFKSSNKKIATVTNKGAIKAKKPGKVTITVTCGKKKASCKITVTN